MFSKEDFELPLEKQLKIRVIMDEIDNCDDVNILKENLRDCVNTLSQYQHLLAKSVEKQLLSDLEKMDPELSKIVSKSIGNFNDG